MRYRDAKNLHNGDEVTRKEDKAVLTVKSIELFGQYKKVKLNCVCGNTLVVVYNDEIE